MRRKFLLGAVALILPIGSAIGIGAGSANARANVTGSGTYSCKGLTGIITFTPGITLTAKTVTIATKSTATGCTGGKPGVTTATSTSSKKAPGVSCTAIGTATKTSFSTTFTNGAAPSTFTGTNTPGPKTAKPLYFTLKGVVTGSYPSKTATAKANLKETYAQLAAACTSKTGLTAIHIASGTTSNG